MFDLFQIKGYKSPDRVTWNTKGNHYMVAFWYFYSNGLMVSENFKVNLN